MFDPVIKGINIGGQVYKGIFCTLPFFPGFDATFKVDPAALLVAGVTVFLWILSTIHALSYMKIEKKRPRYETMILASLAVNLGVLMAGDFLTLFIFFEGLVIFPYSLIAHKEDEGAVNGANMYLYLGVATSLCLFFGIIFLQQFTGSISIRPTGSVINTQVPGTLKYLLAGLMIFGFGGKAGVFFEHIWLPIAHPVAPTPASALLSGAMIKAGAYGIFRVANMLFIPPDWNATLEWVTVRHVGYGLIWLGVITMFLGVLNALISANSKQMLAYHSISQMGYIVMGIGCAAYMGSDGAMGLAGALYHIVNHALFKASLFLTVGALYFRTHELDMYKMGGLWRNMPFTCVAMFIAVCGISGIPGFNGFASKTLLHHSILEAYEHSAHYAADGLPDFTLRIAEVIFMITAGGTFASNMKLWVLDFFGKRPDKYEAIQPAPVSMKISLGLVSAAILLIGLFPNWLLEQVIGPALAYFHFNPSSHPYHMLYNTHAAQGLRTTIPILYDPRSFAFFSDSKVVHNLLGTGDAVIFGGTIFILGLRMGWFHTKVPVFLTVEYYYQSIYQAFKRYCRVVFAKFDVMYDRFWEMLIFGCSISAMVADTDTGSGLADISSKLEDKFSQAVDGIVFLDKSDENGELSTAERKIWQELKQLEEKYNEAFDKTIFGRQISALINNGESGERAWQELKQLDEQHGEAFDKKVLNKNIQTRLKLRAKKVRAPTVSGKGWWKRFSEFDTLSYDTGLDKLLFGNIDPSAKPQENWFEKFCRRLSSIHSGDIGRYISWIIIILAIMITTLIGRLYITSFLGLLLMITLVLFLVIMAIFLS
jgi:formate hydrogenlyase subunit 3/multisubunit Na+/H+ antiporter MnhD subunit